MSDPIESLKEATEAFAAECDALPDSVRAEEWFFFGTLERARRILANTKEHVKGVIESVGTTTVSYGEALELICFGTVTTMERCTPLVRALSRKGAA